MNSCVVFQSSPIRRLELALVAHKHIGGMFHSNMDLQIGCAGCFKATQITRNSRFFSMLQGVVMSQYEFVLVAEITLIAVVKSYLSIMFVHVIPHMACPWCCVFTLVTRPRFWSFAVMLFEQMYG